jgi:hypothetical protein
MSEAPALKFRRGQHELFHVFRSTHLDQIDKPLAADDEV